MNKGEKLNKEEVVRKARDYARLNGYDLSRYKLDTVFEESHMYHVLFEGKSGLPGDHFSITVSPATKEIIELVQGK